MAPVFLTGAIEERLSIVIMSGVCGCAVEECVDFEPHYAFMGSGGGGGICWWLVVITSFKMNTYLEFRTVCHHSLKSDTNAFYYS